MVALTYCSHFQFMLVRVFSFFENDLVLNQFYVRDPWTRQKKVRVKSDEIRSAIRPLIPVLVLIFVSENIFPRKSFDLKYPMHFVENQSKSTILDGNYLMNFVENRF